MDGIRKKAYGYRRVSTVGQVDGASLGTQTEKITSYAEANNIEIVDWFEDPGYSAKDANRPDLQRMLESIKKHKGEVDFVIIHDSTRLSRNLASFYVDIWPTLHKNGVRLLSATENYGDEKDPTGDIPMIFGVLTGQIDNKNKSNSTKNNMDDLFSNSGWWMGGRTPLGYRIERIFVEGRQRDGHQKSHAILVPDNTNGLADKIAFLLNRFSEGDLLSSDLLQIAHKIDIRGFKGELLAQSTLDGILTNEIYAGYHTSKTMANQQRVKMRFGGIISLETYEKNQRIINKNGKPHEKSNELEYPLSKTACCAICGAMMTDEEREVKTTKGKLPYLRYSAPKSGSGKHTPRYSCKCRGHGSIRASDAHQIFECYLKQITPTKEMVKLFKEIVRRTALKKLGNTNKQISELEAKSKEIRNDKENALKKLLKNDMGLDDGEQRELMGSYDADRSRIESELADLKQIQLLREADIEYVCNFMSMPAKLWRDGDLETKQAIQKMIFPNGIYFDLKNKKCGTNEISPLFSVTDIKKAPSGADLNALGWDIGIEPTTFWTTIRRSNQLS